MLRTFIVFYVVYQTHKSIAEPLVNKYQYYSRLQSVNIFRQYLRIDTSNATNIEHAVDFFARYFLELGIPYAVYKPSGMPILVATVEGSEPSLPSIMLNSHMDVVKADPSEWTYPPFDAYMDSNGDIYGRGTQDTKDISVQYLEAIRRIIKQNITLTRTLHLTFMPDEESGGYNGMKAFVRSKEFKSLNVGFALDEGLTSSDDIFLGLYVDRRPWQMQFTIHGKGGHGFEMTDGSTMEKVQNFINAVMTYRENQKNILKTKNNTDFGYTSLNINVIEGGIATNIIPTKFKLIVDMRLAPQVDVAEMDSVVKSWMALAGNMTELVYIRKETESAATPVDDSNPYWVTMRNTLSNLGFKIIPIICPATSDMLVVRNLGIHAIGFSTRINIIRRIHSQNEYQNAETFVKGIEIYYEIIKNLANVPHCT